MNVIQILQLINKIGNLNRNIDLQEYFENANEIFESELKIIEDSNNEINQRLLIQLKEKSDVELLLEFIKLIDKNGSALEEHYHKYRMKLSESNNSNSVFTTSIPIVCKLINLKLDALASLKIDLLSKIAYFDYMISADFDSNSNTNTLSESNQNQKKETGGKATFNLTKIETIMLFYLLEKDNLLKFQSDEQRIKFIEENFCYTVKQSETLRGESAPLKGTGTEFSNLKSHNSVERNNRTLEKLQEKLEKAILEFKFK